MQSLRRALRKNARLPPSRLGLARGALFSRRRSPPSHRRRCGRNPGRCRSHSPRRNRRRRCPSLARCSRSAPRSSAHVRRRAVPVLRRRSPERSPASPRALSRTPARSTSPGERNGWQARPRAPARRARAPPPRILQFSSVLSHSSPLARCDVRGGRRLRPGRWLAAGRSTALDSPPRTPCFPPGCRSCPAPFTSSKENPCNVTSSR